MLAKRIIPCLDVKNGRVVKGVKFRNHIDMGDPADLAQKYSKQGADELVFYDITASPEGRTVDLNWIKTVAQRISIPFAVAGGINSVQIAREVLKAGADKISINTPALKNPNLIKELAQQFGTQCVVVGIDVLDGKIFQNTGDPKKTENTQINLIEWAQTVEQLGAGEIVLNSMQADGSKNGYDLKSLSQLCKNVSIPIIASGGAGSMNHFLEVFQNTVVTGALAASVFHSNSIIITKLKKFLRKNKIIIRL